NSFEENDKPSEQVNRIVAEGFSQKASDIHIEPHLGEYRLLFRVDGILHEHKRMDMEIGEKIVARVKIVSHLPIYIRDIPQDGRFLWKNEKEVHHDLRVSVIPTIHGEKVVIRLFDENQKIFELEDLGFSDSLLVPFQELL